METIPARLADYLLTLPEPHRAPLYFLVGPEGTLIDSGGAYDWYGIPEISKGHCMSRHPVLFFLEGLLPVTDGPVWIPYLEWVADRFIDVHLLPAERGDWVLILDTTPEAVAYQHRQQRRHARA